MFNRRRIRLTVAGETPTSAAVCLPVWRCGRNVSTAAHVAGGIWLGNERGLEDRSRNPSTPSARSRLGGMVLFRRVKHPGANPLRGTA
jgi:hypothetical protein